jgi:hypothetical protein
MITFACGSVAEKVLKVSGGGRMLTSSDGRRTAPKLPVRQPRRWHTTSSGATKAKSPVFEHWPTALLYGPWGGDGSAAREFFVLAMHHHSWSLALARSQNRRGSGYAGSGLRRSWHRLGCRMGAKTHNPKGLRLNLSEFARRATPKLNLSGLRLA